MLIGVASGKKSLIDFDIHQTYNEGDILLDSPRSVQACLFMGISPVELLAVSYHDVVDQMKRAGESVSDPDVCKMRYRYLCERRERMMMGVVEKRDKIIIEEIEKQHRANASGRNDSPDKQAAAHSTMIYDEEKRLQKIVDTNLSRLRQQLLHRELLQRQREKEDARLNAQRKADEQRRKDNAAYLAEKSRKEEEAQALRNEARELERKKHAAEVELKRAKYEEKDFKVKERLRKSQMVKEAMNESKQLHNLQRRRQMKQQADMVLEKRRSDFEVRWQQFEQDREEYKEELRLKAQQRRAEAERKQEKIESAIERCEEILQAKIDRTNEREAKAQAKLKEHAEERAEQQRKHQEEEAAKERMRQAVYADAQLQLQERAVKFTNRIRQAEARLRRNAELQAEEMRRKHEEQREQELEKKLCVGRSKKIDEARRQSLQTAIERKNEKIEADKLRREILTEKRKLHREEVERSRVHIPESTPGPGDYLVTVGDCGTEGAKWRFGLPASVMSLRTISRTQPPPGYEASPGPGVYQPDTKMYARHRTAPSASMMRHDRWTQPQNAEITPGPADYAPKQDDPIMERLRSTSPGSKNNSATRGRSSTR